MKPIFHRRFAKITGIATLAIGAFVIQPYRPMIFVGTSMTPTYHDHEIAWASTNTSDLKRGDIVVIDTPNGEIVKRIAYMPGDSIKKYYAIGQWNYVTTQLATSAKVQKRFNFIEEEIKPGNIFVLGDDPVSSIDSRQLGQLPISSIRYVLVNPKPRKSNWRP
jgi:signal peptidase I